MRPPKYTLKWRALQITHTPHSIDAGLDAFDMADHYGDAELVIGSHNSSAAQPRPITALTKWCPAEDGVKTFANAEAAVDRALSRMGQSQIALLQYHIWDYADDTYLCNLSHLRTLQQRGKIAHVGLTNTDAAHLELLLHSGFRIATNQVSCSVIDRRLVRGRLSGICAEHGVGILAYGTLLGGFLSEKWVGAPEPTDSGALNWSLRKYLRFIRAAGGWDAFQTVLRSLEAVAKKHGVPIAAVATRWVLDIPVVSAVIVGSRLSAESVQKYLPGNLAAFSFSLTDADRALIAEAQESLADIPGDCGDEYRRPPFLTATGDLSHHIKESPAQRRVAEAIAQGKRVEFRSGSKWEPICVSSFVAQAASFFTCKIIFGPGRLNVSKKGYCRAVRVGPTIRVSGTTANPPALLAEAGIMAAVGGSSARCQTVAALDIVAGAIKKLGGTLRDVVRTRVMLQREEDVDEVSEAHGWFFQCEGVLPANTLTAAGLIGDEFLVEVEAEAVVTDGEVEIVTIM